MARRRPTRPARRQQAGQAFLLTLLVVGVAGLSLVYSLANPARTTLDADARTQAALAMARDGLLGYAAAQPSGGTYRPGELPCPDLNNDGNAEATCDVSTQRIGRLPWRTLGLPDPRDGSAERLWYAVSNVYKRASQFGILNSDTAGDFTVTGTIAASNVIAIVFAPGTAVGTQVRDGANANVVANYLEAENADGDTAFTTATASATFNDKLLLITHDVLFPAVASRVAREIKTAFSTYYSTYGYFPSATPFSDATYTCAPTTYEGRIPLTISAGCPAQADWTAPPWFYTNNWHQLTFYSISWLCSEWVVSSMGSSWCTSFYNLYVYDSTWSAFSSARALLIVSGRALTGQARPCAAATDCVDNSENSDADGTFYAGPLSSSNNDRLVVISP